MPPSTLQNVPFSPATLSKASPLEPEMQSRHKVPLGDDASARRNSPAFVQMRIQIRCLFLGLSAAFKYFDEHKEGIQEQIRKRKKTFALDPKSHNAIRLPVIWPGGSVWSCTA